jgi:hypothetical protein
MSKPLAKSLHTVTVLVRTTKAIADYEGIVPTDAKAIDLALAVLGLDDMPDTYGLVAQAAKQLRKFY